MRVAGVGVRSGGRTKVARYHSHGLENSLSNDARTTEEILLLVVAHYAYEDTPAFDELSLDVQVQLRKETNDLEREVHRRESGNAFPLTRKLLSSSRPTDRFAAMMVLYRGERGKSLREESIQDLLLSRLEVEDAPDVLNQVILWFRYQHKDERVVPILCRLRSHPDYMVRTCIADVLGAYQDNPDAKMSLHALAMDPHVNVRESAEEGLHIDVPDLRN